MPRDKATLIAEIASVRDEIALTRLRLNELRAAYQEYNILVAKVTRMNDKVLLLDAMLAELDGRYVRITSNASLGAGRRVKSKADTARELIAGLSDAEREAVMRSLRGE